MEHDIAVQTVVYGEIAFDEVVDAVASAPVSAIELWDRHLPASSAPETVEEARRRLDEVGVRVVGYGVVDLDDRGDVTDAFATAAALGASYVTVNFDPTDEHLAEALVAAAERHDLDVAVHNYSTVHHDADDVFSSIAEVRSFLDANPHPRLGACVDTGHFLVMEEDPGDAIAELGERVVAVHLKDVSEAAEEDAPGRGVLSLPTLLDRLEREADLSTPPVVEYELPADETAEALEAVVSRIRSR